MTRLAIALLALLIASVAPAKVWCEASCLATDQAKSTTSHCPSHEPASPGTQISGTSTSDCPTIEAARPVTVTLAVSQPATSTPAPGTATLRARAPQRPHDHAATLPLSVPLRI